MGEFQKRMVNFNYIAQQECDYSCRLDGKKFPEPDRTQTFIKTSDIDDAKKEFPKELMDLALNPNYKKIEEWFVEWFADNGKEST